MSRKKISFKKIKKKIYLKLIKISFVSYFIFAISIFFISIFLYGSELLADLIISPEIIKIIPQRLIVFSIFIPLFLTYIIILILLQIILDFLKKKRGTKIRFRIVSFFFIITFIHLITSSVLINHLLENSINLFFNKNLIKDLDNNIKTIQNQIKKEKRKNEKKVFISTQKPLHDLKASSSFDVLIVYNETFAPSVIKKASSFAYPLYSLKTLITSKEDFFSTYKEGYVYAIYPILSQGEGMKYLLGGTYLGNNFKRKVYISLTLFQQIKQLEFFKPFLKRTFLFTYIYFYIIIFSIGVIIFYYSSSQVFGPISLLTDAARKISKGNYQVNIKQKGVDEIKELIKSFSEMARKLKENQIQIKKISHIEAWQEVAMKIAHEIKNPLTPLKLATDQIQNTLIKKDFETFKQLNESFNLINDEIKIIENLISNFSKFSKKIEVEPKKISTNEIIKDLENYLKHYPSIEYSLIKKNNPVIIKGDQKKLRQVFSNLIQNAVFSIEKNSNKKGKTTIKSYIKNVGNDKKFWIIDITDNGIGIKQNQKPYIFTPYYTTKSKGSGLGLYISEQIIKAHKGQLVFKSNPKQTTFSIYLPL